MDRVRNNTTNKKQLRQVREREDPKAPPDPEMPKLMIIHSVKQFPILIQS